MHVLRVAVATSAVCLITACGSTSTSLPTGLKSGTLIGTVTSSLGGAIANATVTATPTGQGAVPGVETGTDGSYSVPNVPGGGGSIAITALPANCTGPVTAPYSGVNGNTVTVNVQVTCQASTTLGTTTLNVGQAALFTDSAPEFATNLTLAPNGIYLITVANTDSASTALEDFSIGGTFTASAAAKRAPGLTVRGIRLKRPSLARVTPRLSPALRSYQKAVAGHIKKMEADERRIRGLGNPLAAGQASRRSVAFSLVGTTVGDVNPVNVPVPSCDTFATVGARTVYAGTHVQILADTSLTNWPARYRPDSSYYNTLGLEYDTLTYAKHLLTYIGDPLQYDAQLSNVGKVTILLTPTLNNVPGLQGAEILAFVSACDFFPAGTGANQIPSSNQTEMIYHLVPDTNNTVAFWEREIRPTLAHESKHIVSLGYHIANGTFLEQVWLEEALAQVSSEIWGRNYNTATWLGNAGFNATLGCEIQGDGDPCSTPTSPLTFSDSHLAFLFSYLAGLDTLGSSSPETLNGTVAGRYGAGWSLARWAIDNYAGGTTPTAEATIIKAMITNVTENGIANVSAITGAPAPQILTYWSLATALDQSTLTDSSSFFAGITDAKTTVPSFDFRNIYGPAPYGRAYAVLPFGLNTGNFTTSDIAGIPGTEQLYILIQAPAGGGTQFLQLLSGSGGAISSSSGFRVGIIRVQ